MRLMFNNLAVGGGSTPPPTSTVLMFNEALTSLPSDWSQSGFTFSGNGASATGVGGMGTKIYYDVPFYTDPVELEATFTLDDADSVIAFGKDGWIRKNVNLNPPVYQRGAFFKVDFTSNQISFGIAESITVEPTPISTSSLTIPHSQGDVFTIKIGRNTDILTASIYNNNNPSLVNQIVLDYAVASVPFWGSFWGHPAFWHLDGGVTVSNFKSTALINSSPKVAFFGDSITEGRHLVTEYPSPHSLGNRYGSKVIASNNGNGYMSPKGGTKAEQIKDEVNYMTPLVTPEYGVVMAGTNNRSFANDFYAPFDELCLTMNNLGIKVVACRIPPASSQNNINNMNSYIDQQLIDGNGRPEYKIFDVIAADVAVSLNGDKVTQNPLYYTFDTLHPNVLGHQAIYNEIAANNSYLLG